MQSLCMTLFKTTYSPGYNLQRSVAKSSSTMINGEQASSREQTQKFVMPNGPTNISFRPIGNFNFLPSQTHLNYGAGFENDPNMLNSQVEAQIKLLQLQIEILQNQLQLLQQDKSVVEGTSLSDRKGKGIASSSSESNQEDIQVGKAYFQCLFLAIPYEETTKCRYRKKKNTEIESQHCLVASV
ncbi:hypothetical protein RIF29_30205 [Crotalaria pallida]|uniref:Uncharacterized protein n=1 Tax=Crotalaria pallida TaxID=3830 RepID=A0AAN9HWK2_CROPI